MRYFAIVAFLAFPAIAAAQEPFDLHAAQDAKLALLCGIRSMEWVDTVDAGIGRDIQVNGATPDMKPLFEKWGPPVPQPNKVNCINLESDPLMSQLDQYVIQANND